MVIIDKASSFAGIDQSLKIDSRPAKSLAAMIIDRNS